MRKSTLFVSAALTTFTLAIMVGVVSAYQKVVQSSSSTETVQQAPPTDAMTTDPSPAANTPGTLTLEEAATLASNVIGHTDLYSAENTQFNDLDAYLITFSSGDLVYVSLDGKILSISKLPVVYIDNKPPSRVGGGGGGNSGTDEGSTSSSSNNGSGSNGSFSGGDDGGGDD